MNTINKENSSPADPGEVDRLARRFSQTGIQAKRLNRLSAGYARSFALRSEMLIERGFDIVVSLLLLCLFAPLLGIGLIACGKLDRRRRIGQHHQTFEEFAFQERSQGPGRFFSHGFLQWLPSLLNVLRGEMAIVGPRPASRGELSPRERENRNRYQVKPGLICLWWVRRRANIAYETEGRVDQEYVRNRSFRGDIALVLRALTTAFYGEETVDAKRHISLLDLPINNITMQEAIEDIEGMLEREKPSQICFLNADCANISVRNSEYRRAVQTSAIVLADGIGLKLAGKLLHQPIRQNVNGTDLFPRLCAGMEGTEHGIYFLGGQPGVVEALQERAQREYPGLKICGGHHGFFTPEEEPDIIDEIRESGAHMLLVAFGAPRQDLWLARNLESTGARVGIGVGGLFDFYSGRMQRAPIWVREMGLEWAYRLIKEPRRLWRRYVVGNVVFLTRVFTHRLRSAATEIKETRKQTV